MKKHYYFTSKRESKSPFIIQKDPKIEVKSQFKKDLINIL